MRAVINANSELIRLAKLDMSSTTFAPPFYGLIIARYNVLVNTFFKYFLFLASTFVGAFLMQIFGFKGYGITSNKGAGVGACDAAMRGWG